MIPHNFDEAEAHKQYDDALKRRDTWPGGKNTIGTIIHAAKEGGYKLPHERPTPSSDITFDLDAARPVFHQNGMPPREFWG